MKLYLPDIMEHIERKDMLLAIPVGLPVVLSRKAKARPTHLLPLMHKAMKFIFDSGSDKDDQTTSAVRETSVNMLEAGLFHLPSPITWIEDPFDDDPTMRFYYLCTEDETGITVHFLQSLPRDMDSHAPRYMVFLNTAFISFTEITDKFIIHDVKQVDPVYGNTFAEAIYSLKKFIVCLNTEDIVREKVDGKPFKAGLPKKFRQYEHAIIRVPLDTFDDRYVEPGSGTGRKRRKHLVRGYTWGRNTRPVEEQRWIRPFFRGSQEVGEVVRDHYVVKSPR